MSGQAARPSPLLWVCAGLGLAGTAATFFASGPQRFFANWLVWFVFMASVGLGALFLVGLGHLLGAVWILPLRRVCERVSSLLLPAIPMGLVALMSLPHLFPWTHPEAMKIPAVAGKAPWLNIPFFAIRTAATLALWYLSYHILVRGSLKQDTEGGTAFALRARKFSAFFMAVFAVTVTLVSFDWISSLEPEWYSDIFGVYLFAGVFLCGLSGSILLAARLQADGRLEGAGPDHAYNLGGLNFAFIVFWSYIAFAQYMLMWYANMPEEVFWYRDRTIGPWLPLSVALMVGHFVVPFFALVARESKRDLKKLRWVAAWILLMHYMDLCWLVFPSLHRGFFFGWQEISFALLFVPLGLLLVRRYEGRGAEMPVGDPRLDLGLKFKL
jgi:hypothetical protein